jgi:sortase (surface protein transpeptidase)
VAALIVLLCALGCTSQAGDPQARQGAHRPAASPSPTPSTTPLAPPARLQVPKIGVDAPVDAVGTDSQDRMAAPTTADHVGWFRPGPVPGAPGNAVFDGHLDWYGTPHAVFWRLGQLRIGDEVTVVGSDGSRASFAVFASDYYAYDAHPPGLFATNGSPSLALITCAGSWDRAQGTYLQRLVVMAAPVVTPSKSLPPAVPE